MKFEVIAKCGHVGKNHYILRTFAVEAASASEAAAITRRMPRVKHDHKDAIRSVAVIGDARFLEIMEMQRSDPYFRCHSIQEQRAFCLELELLPEQHRANCSSKREQMSRKDFYIGKKKIRNPKKVFDGRPDYEPHYGSRRYGG